MTAGTRGVVLVWQGEGWTPEQGHGQNVEGLGEEKALEGPRPLALKVSSCSDLQLVARVGKGRRRSGSREVAL